MVEAVGAVVAVVGVLDDVKRGTGFVAAAFDVVETELIRPCSVIVGGPQLQSFVRSDLIT